MTSGIALLRTTFPSPEYTIEGTYIDVIKSVEVRHNCGFTFNPSVSKIKGRYDREIKCPDCYSNFKKEETRKKNEKEFLSYFDNTFEILGEFIIADKGVEVKFPCGHVNKSSLNNLKRGHTRCRICANRENTEKLKTPEKEAMEILEKRYPEPEYTIRGKYVKAGDAIDVIHNTCGGTLLRPSVGRLSNCPKCSAIENGLKCRIPEEVVMPKVRAVYSEERNL